jgi:putative ABC transport system permease protein
MPTFHSSLFFRIVRQNFEIYLLKILSLAIAFACALVIAAFSWNEFGYDKFHREADKIVRVLKRNESANFEGNRLSNRIPAKAFNSMHTSLPDSLQLARVKVMEQITVETEDSTLTNERSHVADPALVSIFTFDLVEGRLGDFEHPGSALLSVSAAQRYFGSHSALDKKFKVISLKDTLQFKVTGIFKDYPQNSHEEFHVFIRFDTASIRKMEFDPNDFSVYGKVKSSHSLSATEKSVNKTTNSHPSVVSYKLQPLTEIYFGPRVLGDSVNHGDYYSILILTAIVALILFLAFTNFINLTTLILPKRSKELALKKVAGATQRSLVVMFLTEYLFVTGIAFVAGVIIILSLARITTSFLSFDSLQLIAQGGLSLGVLLVVPVLVISIAPLVMAFRFIKTSPGKLLGTETITFPRFKKFVTIFQFGTCLSLIVAGSMINRQINRSLIKEPGRNHDQIVYIRYPPLLSMRELEGIKKQFKTCCPNIVELTATSHLPNNINSKPLHASYYTLFTDKDFIDFFDLELTKGTVFNSIDADNRRVVNEKMREHATKKDLKNVIGVVKNFSSEYNQQDKPVTMAIGDPKNFNFLLIRIYEVDIRITMERLSRYFSSYGKEFSALYFFDKKFERGVSYENKLNKLSLVLTWTSVIISCLAIYGLSLSRARDRTKEIAIHKMFGASAMDVIVILMREFVKQMATAILIFGPITFLLLREWLRNFAYNAPFQVTDTFFALGYSLAILTITCSTQAMRLSKASLTAAVK